MLRPDQIEGLQIAFQRMADPLQDYLIEDIVRRVAQAGQFTSTAAYEVWRAQMLGISQREIKAELRKRLKLSHQEIRRLFDQAAEDAYVGDLRRFPQVQAVQFSKNLEMQQIVSAAVKLAGESLDNITQTLGLIGPDGVVTDLTEAYRKTCDFAFNQVITGTTDYNTAIRQACSKLAGQGIQIIDYESGVKTSLEAAIRRNMMGGLGLMVEQVQNQTHDDLGCDGWEISAHANSAPDHEPIQGRQYSDAEYQTLNFSLLRRIGTLNCGHVAFPIILGVNEPQYTQEELDKFRADNEAGITTVDGKHYTGYEAREKQRYYERAIRAQKRRVLAAKTAGNQEWQAQAEARLQALRIKYKSFSTVAGRRTEEERLHVSGYA